MSICPFICSFYYLARTLMHDVACEIACAEGCVETISANVLKDVRANCFCASLLRTQNHATSSMSARALSIKISNDREDGHCYSFAWI